MPIARSPQRLFVLALIMAGSVILAMSLQGGPARAASLADITVAPFDRQSVVAQENQQPGTSAWQLDDSAMMAHVARPPGDADATGIQHDDSSGARDIVDTAGIQGYADTTSAVPGQLVTIYVSTPKPVDFMYAIYRIGWYGGLGGRLYYTSPTLRSRAQGIWTPAGGLRDCPTCVIDPQTYRIDAHWHPSDSFIVGNGWVSGVYLIKLQTASGAESYIPLVVRDDTAHSAALVNLATNTYQAYNTWGGYSFYSRSRVISDRATQVSFNRPYARSAGAGDFLYWDIQAVRWIERSGLDVTYTTDDAMSDHPELLLQHRIVLVLGHDEYWTKAMRDGVTAARDSGVSLAFWGANDGYWQVRLAPDDAGNADRTLVCYKVLTSARDPSMQLARDPMYPKHPELVTTQFRDPLLNRPENGLLGIMYLSMIPSNDTPDWVAAGTDAGGLEAQAHIAPGEHISGGLVGYEYDGFVANGAAPRGLVTLAASPVVNVYGGHQTAMTTYYRAASGAIVFDAGTLWWSWGLDSLAPAGGCRNRMLANQMISDLTASLLRAMLAASPPR